MSIAFKRIACIFLLMSFVCLAGFSISSGFLTKCTDSVIEKISYSVERCLRFQLIKIVNYPWANYYLLLPLHETVYTLENGLTFGVFVAVIISALFNFLCQPVFLSVLTPQTVFNCALIPFFLYGVFRYFRKVPVMILLFFVLAIFIGMNNAIVEPLMRHRLSCELIYLLIGLAGFTDWITKD